MQEINHLTREASSQSCCSVLNASSLTSQGPLLVRKLLKHKEMHKQLKLLFSYCKNLISVADKEKKRRKDRVLYVNITAQTCQGLTQHSSKLTLLATTPDLQTGAHRACQVLCHKHTVKSTNTQTCDLHSSSHNSAETYPKRGHLGPAYYNCSAEPH